MTKRRKSSQKTQSKKSRTEQDGAPRQLDPVFGQYRALPVSLEVLDRVTENSIPTSAEEYLAIVRKQAENSSSVMFVPRSTPDESTEAPEEPVTKQQNDVDSFHSAVVEEFTLQRDQLPEAGTLDIPSGFIFPLIFTSWRQYMMTHDPTVELVSNMDHELTIKLLIYSTKWLSPRIPQRLSQWMYAIMTRVSEPLEASDVSVLRDLAKRAKTLTHRDQLDDTTLFTLQFVINIVGGVFGQRDLLS